MNKYDLLDTYKYVLKAEKKLRDNKFIIEFLEKTIRKLQEEIQHEEANT